MRIAIREQLALLVLFCCLVSVAVLSVAVWITNTNFVMTVSSGKLSLAATLYAEQLASNILLIQSSAESLSTRVLIQNALGRYNNVGNNSDSNWIKAQQDLQVGLGAGGAGQYLLQAQIYGPDTNGAAGANPVISTTSNSTLPIQLPSQYTNGTTVVLGDNSTQGYPQNLYPLLNLTRQVENGSNMTSGSYLGTQVNMSSPLLLGPWPINQTFALASMTIPVLNNTSRVDILGWITIVFSCDLIYLVANSVVGLGSSGINLIVSPNTTNNRLPQNIDYNTDMVRFVVPPLVDSNRTIDRHPESEFHFGPEYTFTYGSFPAVESVFTAAKDTQKSASSNLDTVNEEGDHVSLGYARIATNAADWAIIVEESYDEVHAPFITLRNVLLACIFGTIGAILLAVFPLAHYLVRPIRSLRDATRKTVDPYDFSVASDSGESSDALDTAGGTVEAEHSGMDKEQQELARKEGFISRVNPFRRAKNSTRPLGLLGARRFRIPGKVAESKHIIYDELTDLTTTFNGMCDELMMQYARLEERVKERTAELELSKKAAEAANESKTLFIANISHELKTPLNGILGMCAVSMSEDDPNKIKKSLNIIYKSGDLLLNLLTDLLTFSKNQIGQHLTLDEKEFRLADISSQVLSIFDKQAREGQISLNVLFEGPTASVDAAMEGSGQAEYGPSGTGRVQDMWLWGDQHRILQVVINLVSNSLKFTPPGGSVTVRLQCLAEVERPELPQPERKDSTLSRNSKVSGTSKDSAPKSGRSLRFRSRNSSSKSSVNSGDPSPQLQPKRQTRDNFTALEINAREPRVLSSPDTSNSTANGTPINARILLFNFEVQDTGPGIPPAQQSKIFEPFVQGDLGLSKKYGGTGLGLSICSQLASLMKGQMTLTSAEGEGSTFSMQIPLRFIKEQAESMISSEAPSQRNSLVINASSHPASDEAIAGLPPPGSPTRAIIDNSSSKPRLVGLSQPFFAPAPSLDTDATQMEVMERVKAEVASKGSKVRVLVAEDNKVNQEVVLRMLKLEDIYDVTVAKDGQEAYELVKKSMEENRLFNVIFMDVQMPNLDGLQSTRLIRGIGYSAPIVALTAFAEESNVKDCMDSGMDYFLPKPIKRPALKQVLKRYCATIPESDEPESPPVDKQKAAAKAKAKAIPTPAPALAPAPVSASESNSIDTMATTTSPLDFTAQTTPEDVARYTNQSTRDKEDHDVSPLS